MNSVDAVPSGHEAVLPRQPAAPEDEMPATRLDCIEDSWLYQQYDERINKSDNDFIFGIASASKSGISGTGKTTLGLRLLRDKMNNGDPNWSADDYAAMSGHRLSHDLLANHEIDDGTGLFADEMQGTLSDYGIDARRHMATSVIKVVKALATMRFRGFPVGIIMQSASWMDERMLMLFDALILIQGRGDAHVYHYYQNDLTTGKKEYYEFKDRITWDPLPPDDEDYLRLQTMKEETTVEDLEQEEEEQVDIEEVERDWRNVLIKELYDVGYTQKEIAEHERVDVSKQRVQQILNDD